MSVPGGFGQPVWRAPEASRSAPHVMDEWDDPKVDDRHGRMLNWLTNRRTRRRDYDDRRYVNRERYNGTRGRHWMRFHPGDGWLHREAIPRYRVQWTAPQILARGEQFISLIGTTPVQYGAVPASNDPEDRESAAAVTKFLRALANDENFTMLRMDAARLGYVDGMCYLMAYWDIARGRARVQVRDSSCVFIEPTAKSLEDSPVVCVETWEHFESLKADFPGFKGWRSFSPRVSEIPPTVRRDLMASEDLTPYGYTRGDDTDVEGIVARREFHIMPSQKRPRGQYVVMCNNTVLYDSDQRRAKDGSAKPGLPYIDAGITLPIHAFRYKTIPGNFYGLSGVEIQWDNVRIKERIVSQMFEGIALTVRPKVRVGRTTNVEGRFTADPGEVWAYDAAAGEPKPEIVTFPGPDPSVWNAIAKLDQDNDDHIGINAASRGQMPARVDSGRAIKLLQNADLGVAQIASMYLDDAFSGVAWDCVRLERTFGSGERTRQVIGTSSPAQNIAFTNETFDGTANVWIKSSQYIGYTPAMIAEEARALFADGVIDINEYRQMIARPPADAAQASEFAVNYEAAEAENFLMEQGQTVEVRPFEMNAVHAYAHRVFFQQKFDTLSDEAKQAFFEHIYMTEALALQAAAGNAAMGGESGGAGKPPSAANGDKPSAASPQQPGQNAPQQSPQGVDGDLGNQMPQQMAA